MERSPLQRARQAYQPKVPPILREPAVGIAAKLSEPTESYGDAADLKRLFPKTYGMPIARFVAGTNEAASRPLAVGVILSGGQAPGGHNVIAGLVDGLKGANDQSKLYGFLGGPSGLVNDEAIEITKAFVDEYRNTGGFDMIGSGRTKIESDEQFAAAAEVAKRRRLDAIVVIGGDDSNTNAALLAEYFVAQGLTTRVIGVPKTIDGDLKNEHIEVSFGFDTATKTYAELIGNIARDANSAKKYWHFIRLMGRSASHIGLECALQTRPNVAIISEEVAERRMTLDDIVKQICDTVMKRAENGQNFGIVLVPEGLIEFIPEIKVLIGELNDLLAKHTDYYNSLRTFEDQAEWINRKLSRDSSYAFSSLPNEIQRQLLMDRDPHGNVQVSRIETEKLLIEMVENNLNQLKAEGVYKGKFSWQSHFFGYEGRCAFPSNFDSDYTYSLGYAAFLLVASNLTGYIASVRNLDRPADEWEVGGIPLTTMMNMEQRHGKMKPVIKKALVELDGAPFRRFAAKRDEWAIRSDYRYPGSIQYFGPADVADAPTITLTLERA